MDEKSNHSVRVMFKKMYDDGFIYKGDYLVNWDPATQTWRRPATAPKQVQPTKTTVDLLSSVRSGSEIADLGFDLVYNPIQDAIYGQEQVIPVIGQLKSTAEQLLDPEVAEFAEKANRYNINAFLPYARTLAPVTELDAEKLQIAKGLLQ